MLVLSNLGKDSDMDDPRTVPNSDLPAEFEDLLAGFTGQGYPSEPTTLV
jgi:hypothetical protein